MDDLEELRRIEAEAYVRAMEHPEQEMAAIRAGHGAVAIRRQAELSRIYMAAAKARADAEMRLTPKR